MFQAALPAGAASVLAWLIMALLATALGAALAAWVRRRRAFDLFYAGTLAPWLVFMALAAIQGAEPATAQFTQAARLAYQLAMMGVTLFLFHCATTMQPLQWALVGFQAVVGGALALFPPVQPHAWLWFNTVCASLLALLLAHAVRQDVGERGWMALLVGVCGLGVAFVDQRAAGRGAPALSVSHYFYAVALFILWRAVGKPRQEETLKSPDSALRQERQRMADELHDGVGAQLTSLISALDYGSPEQRATAATLQHCLLELKLAVDGLQQGESVIEHLASLRYRMQPLLEAASVEMEWVIADEAMLERFEGDRARETMRVAQEALANAIRHSGASRVKLACCYVKSRKALMMEVADNGVGLPSRPLVHGDPQGPGTAGGGKGLHGMQRRAERLGGTLELEGRHGQGTVVRLLVPFDAPARAAERPPVDRAAA